MSRKGRAQVARERWRATWAPGQPSVRDQALLTAQEHSDAPMVSREAYDLIARVLTQTQTALKEEQNAFTAARLRYAEVTKIYNDAVLAGQASMTQSDLPAHNEDIKARSDALPETERQERANICDVSRGTYNDIVEKHNTNVLALNESKRVQTEWREYAADQTARVEQVKAALAEAIMDLGKADRVEMTQWVQQWWPLANEQNRTHPPT